MTFLVYGRGLAIWAIETQRTMLRMSVLNDAAGEDTGHGAVFKSGFSVSFHFLIIDCEIQTVRNV